jgi:hypothetical protein
VPKTPTVAATLKAAGRLRQSNLLLLVGDGRRFATQVELAQALDVTDSYLSQIIGPKPRRPFSEATARKFEYKLNLPRLTLDRG